MLREGGDHQNLLGHCLENNSHKMTSTVKIKIDIHSHRRDGKLGDEMSSVEHLREMKQVCRGVSNR